MKYVYAGVHINAFIHPRAVVENATVGAGTRVWQHASIIRDAWIGRVCTIASCVLVDAAKIGDGCIIGHGAAIEPGVILEDHVFVGPGVVFCNDVWPSVFKDDFDMEQLLHGEVVTTQVFSRASIGARAVVLPGVVIGEGAIVAAGAVVKQDVPAHCLLRRDDTLEPIDPDRLPNRMRNLILSKSAA